MKENERDYSWLGGLLIIAFAITVLILVIRYFVYVDWQIQWTKDTEIKCFENGYTETRYHLSQRKAYCVRTENGNTVIVPVEELE